jgi:arylsulfatase A-like enzyme
MRSEEVTIAEALREAGYATGGFGKWHNGAQYPNHPNGQGFDEFFGFCGGAWNLYVDAPSEQNGRPVQTQGYITGVLYDMAADPGQTEDIAPKQPELADQLRRAHEAWFADVSVGVIELPKGPAQLSLRALSKPGRKVCDLEKLRLRRLD